jgi:ATP-dependent DNA helicase RecG
MDLNTPVGELGLSFRLKKSALQRLNIVTLEDLLFHLPFRYEDFTNVLTIRNLKIGEQSVIRGKVLDIKNEYTKRRFVLQKAKVMDSTGSVECTWFNQTYITRIIHPGDEIGLVGKLEFFGKKPTFQVKEYEVLTSESGLHTTGFVPVYNVTSGLTSKWLRNRIADIFAKEENSIAEYLPQKELSKLKFENLYSALKTCHFPQDLKSAELARNRLAFDELLLSHLAALKRRREWEEKNKGVPFSILNFKFEILNFISSLPFTLTQGQEKALEEIKTDLQKSVPMNRLLEGDVGSGKTVVAAISMYIAHLNNYQSVLMAPTEILANQHYETISNLFKPLDISVGLLTGSSKTSSKLTNLNSKFSILVGTHALIQKNVNFEKLGLVVIDEQQRFGVEQRSILREKGTNPHFLTMTATPIPRTILLAIYKDLDISLLNELPKGRQKIKTWLVPNKKTGKSIRVDQKTNN